MAAARPAALGLALPPITREAGCLGFVADLTRPAVEHGFAREAADRKAVGHTVVG